MSVVAASLTSAVIGVATLVGLCFFAVWEHRRHNRREADFQAAMEAAKHRPVTDEVDERHREWLKTLYPTQTVGIYNCPEHATPGGSK